MGNKLPYDDLSNKWSKYWGFGYSWPLKEKKYKPYLIHLEKKKLIGPIIFDIGCGAHPISDCLSNKNKIILIDIVGDEGIEKNKIRINYDINKLSDLKCPETRSLYLKIKKLLDHNKISGNIDTIILSDVLNYIEHKKVLPELYKLLTNNGRLIIFNNLFRTISPILLSGNRVSSNFKLINYLKNMGFFIGHDGIFIFGQPPFSKVEKDLYKRKRRYFSKTEYKFNAQDIMINARKFN